MNINIQLTLHFYKAPTKCKPYQKNRQFRHWRSEPHKWNLAIFGICAQVPFIINTGTLLTCKHNQHQAAYWSLCCLNQPAESLSKILKSCLPQTFHTNFPLTFSLRVQWTTWNRKYFSVIAAFKTNLSWSFILVRHTEEEAMVIHTFSSFLMTTHTAAEIYSLEYLNEHLYRKLLT